MVDIDKFIISMIKSQKRSGYKPDFHWLGMAMIEALKDQGLEYKEGAIVTTSPNLAESEDERIRKYLIRVTEGQHSSNFPTIEGFSREQILAWLEKQGEQKFFINDKVVHKATGKIWTIHHYLKDTNSYYVEDNDGLLHYYRESELKLVEQEPDEWSKEDLQKEIKLEWKNCNPTDEGMGCEFANISVEQFDEIARYFFKLKYKIHNPTEWSGEDEKMIKSIIASINQESIIDGLKKKGVKYTLDSCAQLMDSQINYLKSIKGRVQQQPKQEWSEEDEYHKRQILRIHKDNGCSKTLQEKTEKWIEERLKSLKDRYTWRPSEEQMEALEHFVRSVGESDYASPYDNDTKLLYSLLSDLKKLKA